MKRRRLTSLDVARLAGVNQSTVSRALRPDGRVSAETRAKVQAAAEQLGYTPNAIARSLITQRTNIIGILTADLTNPFQPSILEKFLHTLQSLERQVLVFTAMPDQQVDDLLPMALQYQVDALVVTFATLSSQSLIECSRSGTRVVLFSRYMQADQVSSVTGDNVAAGRQIAAFLWDQGHRDFAYIGGDPNSSTNRDREHGFMSLLWERGAAKPLQESAGRYSYEEGREAANRLLMRAGPLDAIFCAADPIAIGTIDAAREVGLRVPEDLSIVGFDDIPMARWDAYSLTTIHLPIDEMIDATIDLLLQEPNAQQAPVHKLFPGKLIERGSTQSRNRQPGDGNSHTAPQEEPIEVRRT